GGQGVADEPALAAQLSGGHDVKPVRHLLAGADGHHGGRGEPEDQGSEERDEALPPAHGAAGRAAAGGEEGGFGRAGGRGGGGGAGADRGGGAGAGWRRVAAVGEGGSREWRAHSAAVWCRRVRTIRSAWVSPSQVSRSSGQAVSSTSWLISTVPAARVSSRSAAKASSTASTSSISAGLLPSVSS